MGYDRVSIEVTARVSRHNSPRDDEHDALWDELKAEVRKLVDDPRYAAIDAEAY